MSKDLELEAWIDEQDRSLDRERMVDDMWTEEVEHMVLAMTRDLARVAILEELQEPIQLAERWR